jgi:hypothetical protein
MLQAEYFLRHGGQKGTQLTVLKPGQYRLNRYLFDVSLQQALDVEAGFVAVIKSNVQEAANCPVPGPVQQEAHRPDRLAVPLVPRGCVGVWQEPLQPGRYSLNQMAYQATLMPTRAQSLVYSGGYVHRGIDLTVDAQGTIVEQGHQRTVPTPSNAADGAIVVTVEGWRIPLEVRLVIQVDAEQAPRLVAAVGDLHTLEETLLTPLLRSVVCVTWRRRQGAWCSICWRSVPLWRPTWGRRCRRMDKRWGSPSVRCVLETMPCRQSCSWCSSASTSPSNCKPRISRNR